MLVPGSCPYSNVYKVTFIMSRKIYIYNRAALLYKRGASLRNWMQKVRLHRAAFHFPRASPKVMRPAFSVLSKPHIFCPNSVFFFCGNLTFFWQRKEKVTFAFKSGLVCGFWQMIQNWKSQSFRIEEMKNWSMIQRLMWSFQSAWCHVKRRKEKRTQTIALREAKAARRQPMKGQKA